MAHSLFLRRHSVAIRSWHWLTFLVIAFLLFTVAAGKTFLNNYHLTFIIDHTTRDLGVKLTPEQLWVIVRNLRESIWKWHTRAGYILGVLFALRVTIELTQGTLTASIRRALQFLKLKPFKRQARHLLLVQMIYLALYGLLATIIGTGLGLAWYKTLGQSDEGRFHSLKDIHENCLVFLLLFIFIHLAGVITGERRKHQNIVSGMIHGKGQLTAESAPDQENSFTRTKRKF